VAERIKQADIVISTALIPGRKAPVLITERCEIDETGFGDRGHASSKAATARLRAGKTVIKHGVTLIGETNLPHWSPQMPGALRAQSARLSQAITDKDGKSRSTYRRDRRPTLVCRRPGF